MDINEFMKKTGYGREFTAHIFGVTSYTIMNWERKRGEPRKLEIERMKQIIDEINGNNKES